MAITNTTTLTKAIATKLQKDLIPVMKGQSLFRRFASKSTVEKGVGTLQVDRLLRAPRITSALANGEATTTDTPIAFTADALVVTPSPIGSSFQFTSKQDLTSIIERSTFRDYIADHMIRSTEYIAGVHYATHCLRHRVDNDSTYEGSGTAEATSTTTTVVDATGAIGTGADNAWGSSTSAFGVICFTAPEGRNYDQAFHTVDSDDSDNNVTTETMQQAPDTTSKYHIAMPTTIAAGDTMTLAALTRVAAMHEKLKTEKFEGGMFYGIISPEQKQDLYNDTTYQTIIKYSKPEIIGKYSVIPVLDMNLIVHEDGIYREDTTGAADVGDGVCCIALIFGKNAFGITKWGNGGDAFGVEIGVIDKPDSGNYYGFQRWLTWSGWSGVWVERATSIVGLMTGYTSINVTI